MKYSEEYIQNIIQRHHAAVYRTALAYVGSEHDAQDIMQEVFMRLWRACPTFNDEEHERAWLLCVASNCSKTALASRNRRRRREVLTDSVETASLTRGEDNGRVLEAVMTLPPKIRLCIHLFYYEELSVAEIAQTAGMMKNTVKTNLRRGRERLREILKGEYDNVE